jgi:hypothetical protein
MNVKPHNICPFEGVEGDLFRSCSFAAERPIPGLILAICTASVSSDPRSKGHF